MGPPPHQVQDSRRHDEGGSPTDEVAANRATSSGTWVKRSIPSRRFRPSIVARCAERRCALHGGPPNTNLLTLASSRHSATVLGRLAMALDGGPQQLSTGSTSIVGANVASGGLAQPTRPPQYAASGGLARCVGRPLRNASAAVLPAEGAPALYDNDTDGAPHAFACALKRRCARGVGAGHATAAPVLCSPARQTLKRRRTKTSMRRRVTR